AFHVTGVQTCALPISPPRFTLFLNRADLFNRAYEKYLTNELRAAFGYEGCPIVLVPRARPKSIEPVRRTKPAESGQRASGTARRSEEHTSELQSRENL